ncbi:MAG: phosphoenolpyruvate--protein phosphotransferase, partial [Lachnospiraceae bacterium]|nr:phosphoenolpyruvate--protein phosphotransferase [Lachnospiraceae bacterium]
RGLYDEALKETGKTEALVFKAHGMMLDDPVYLETVRNIIGAESVNAEYAVDETAHIFSKLLSDVDDGYIQARNDDVRDISDRVIDVLLGDDGMQLNTDEQVILLVDELTPSETLQLDRSRVLAFVTRSGAVNSHSSILARSMNIPALTGIDYSEDADGRPGIVDGSSGTLIIDPDEATVREYKKKQEDEKKKIGFLRKIKGKDCVTADGRKIRLYANIGSISEVKEALDNDAEGVGLFRSEFIYLARQDYPTEEEQFRIYRTVAEDMAGKRVVIRTLDIGSDKQANYFNLIKEDNPALGYRGIRISLDRIDIFKTQLRAIYKASYYGNISVMFPMIVSLDEVLRIKEIIAEVKKELYDEGTPCGESEIGVMIETPAAVFLSEELAREVDFLSIGTNDLTQYMLAADRQNPKLYAINDPHHPAVLKAIRTTIENGHKGGARVGICGELAADTSLTGEFLRMGIDELSVSPSGLLSVKEAVRRTDLSK